MSGETLESIAKHQIIQVLNYIKTFEISQKLFSEPVENLIPEYRDIINTPIDFTIIRKNLENNKYKNYKSVKKDVKLIYSNSLKFNGSDNIVTLCAKFLYNIFKDQTNNLKGDPKEQWQKEQEKIYKDLYRLLDNCPFSFNKPFIQKETEPIRQIQEIRPPPEIKPIITKTVETPIKSPPQPIPEKEPQIISIKSNPSPSINLLPTTQRENVFSRELLNEISEKFNLLDDIEYDEISKEISLDDLYISSDHDLAIDTLQNIILQKIYKFLKNKKKIK